VRGPTGPPTGCTVAAHLAGGGRGADAVDGQVELLCPANPPAGCAFSTRCPYAKPLCHERAPEPTPRPDGGTVACHFPVGGADALP
jgi:ABC-type dipeptide/oligopeptide/nickel transport system, ATPase component